MPLAKAWCDQATDTRSPKPALVTSLYDGHRAYVQPGDQILAEARKKVTVSVSDMHSLISNTLQRPYYKTRPQKLPPALYEFAARLLISMLESQPLATALEQKFSDDPAHAMKYLRSAYSLFPIERYDVMHNAALAKKLLPKRMENLAASMYLDPSRAFPSPATSESDAFIQPLIESASVTIFNQPASAIAQIQFKADGAQHWQDGHDLFYEPSRGVHTGSIVFLTAGTIYKLRVTLLLDGKIYQQKTYPFTTWPDKPPIDPNKVYYLKDIYKGGMLDLDALGIEGKPGAWARVVGDDQTPIVAGNEFEYGLHIGNRNYIYLENITILRGGRRHGIRSYRAHHIWLNGCDIAKWGRTATVMKEGRSYEFKNAAPIDYDAGLYFRESGAVVVENCHVHSPVPKANHWGYGHPKGATAFFAHANHPDPKFKGQIVLRNNVFEGSAKHRFNDVIEGRSNGRFLGGFIRDSAIYNNVLRYSNDDGIEIDGGQSNVLVYNNDISYVYSGISVAPNRLGPSYVFNNYIHNLGDETGRQWSAIKAGGLAAGPIGQVNLFGNLITVARNGISASAFNGDRTFWLNAMNNIIITKKSNTLVGYGIYDHVKYSESKFINNYIFNLKLNKAKNDASITTEFHDPNLVNMDFSEKIYQSVNSVSLPTPISLRIKNFTHTEKDGEKITFGIISAIHNHSN
ncbi:right-handed parallel beta-helix repeat-containing protein [Alteromonas aestuariivivens]|uniref:Right-handed parallel beta-helix repeat-containing protein n=2 Tax=Alteromonas aestuariivivens TaxID=1938339 RepID=A0A3D8MCQ5_9ALTE|nr:right-handed parallel beta-helix repeat-containing protein [Alteromonas aestuariivivens]